MIDELQHLLNKITESEDLVKRAERYFHQTQHQWSGEVSAAFQDMLARKKDQIDYEWSRVYQMGLAIALDHDPNRLDI